MKKKHYLLSLVFLIFFFIASYYVVGYFFEKQYTNNLELLGRNLHNHLKIVQYNRGLFHSNAIIAANFPLTDHDSLHHQNLNGPHLLIRQHIYHGPFIFYKNAKSYNVKFALAYIDSYLHHDNFFAQTKVSFNQDIATNLMLKQYTQSENGNLIYSLNGLDGFILFSHHANFYQSKIKLHRLYSNIDKPRTIQNFGNDTQLNKIGDVWLGKTNYHFDLLSWQQGERHYTFKNFNYAMGSQDVAQKLIINIQATAESILLNTKNYGAQSVVLSFHELNHQAFQTLQRNLLMPNMAMHSQFSENLSQHLLALLSNGATLKIDNLALNTAWGPFIVKGNIICPKQTDADFFTFISKTKTDINAKLPIALLNLLVTDYILLNMNYYDLQLAQTRTSDFLNKWQSMGWINQSGNDFLINLHLPMAKK